MASVCRPCIAKWNHTPTPPLLLVVRDEHEKVFGAMLSCTIAVSNQFCGTGESYLFSVEDNGEVKVYLWTGINNHIFKGDVDSFSVGGGEGHYGLWLHESLLRGSSYECMTFNNPCLSTNTDFECTGVEVWGFKT
eukprot:Em0005g1611a